MTKVKIDIQKVSKEKFSRPHKSQFKKWFEDALIYLEQNATYAEFLPKTPAEVCIRIVDPSEIIILNNKFRDVNKSTNVLSFPIECPEDEPINLLGDIVICGEVIAREAKERNIEIKNHWTHLFLHALLHLLGFQHDDDDDAQKMQQVEKEILQGWNIADPYQ